MSTNRRERGRRFYWKYALIIFLLAISFRAVYLIEAGHRPDFNLFYMDEEYHLEWARSLATGDWNAPYDQLKGMAYFRAPLYPHFLAALLASTGNSTLAVRVLQIVMGALSCVLVYAIGARSFGQRTGFVAGVLCSVYWVLAYFDTQLLLPVLLVFLLLTGMLLLLTASERRSALLAAMGALSLGLYAITRPNILVFFPFVILWAFRARKHWSPALSRWFVILPVLGLILPPAVVTLRNRVVADDWVIVASQGGVNFYIGNNSESNGMQAVVPGTRQTWWGGYEDTRAIAERAMGRPLKASEISDYWFGRGFDYIRQDTAGWIRLTLCKALAFIGNVELPNNEPYEVYRKTFWSLRLVPLSFAVLFGLFLVSLPKVVRFERKLRGRAGGADRARGDFIRLVLALVLVYSLTVIAFFVTGRYRVPLVPVFAIGAALSLVSIFDYIRRRDVRTAAVMVLASALIVTLLSFDYLGVREETAGFADLSIANDLLDTGDPGGAILRLEKVRTSRSVRAPEVHKLLARAYLMRNLPGDRQPLSEVVEEGVSLYPEEPELIWYSAVGHFERENWPQARVMLMRFLEHEPRNMRAIYLGFAVAMGTGNRGEAETYLQRGEDIDAAHPLVENMRLDLGY